MATVTVGVTAASPGDHRLHLSGELHDIDLLPEHPTSEGCLTDRNLGIYATVALEQ